MPKRLSDAQVAQFQRDGFCAPIELFTPAEAAGYRRRFEEVEASFPEAVHTENRNNAHYVLTVLDEITHHHAILDAVEDLIGPDLLLWGTVLFVKEPQHPGFVSYHQDATYTDLDPHDAITVWLALTAANPTNGCMRMLPGSHRGPIRPHEDTFGADNLLTRGQTIQEIDESALVDVWLEPGQISIHHQRVIHGSLPNRGDDRRIGLAIQHYMPTYMRQTRSVGYAELVRGEDRYHHFEPTQRPEYDMAPAAVAFREKANAGWSDTLYEGADQVRSY